MQLERRQLLRMAALGSLGLAGCTGGGDGGGADGGGQTPTRTATATPTETATESAGDATATATPTETEVQADKTIVMKNTVFQTLKADVETGATVKWVNEDGFAHTITSAQFHDVAKSWSFDAQVSGGGSATHTFDEKGVYEYYCTIHGKSTMCGAVLVGGATLSKSLPCGGDGGGGGGGGGGGYY